MNIFAWRGAFNTINFAEEIFNFTQKSYYIPCSSKVFGQDKNGIFSVLCVSKALFYISPLWHQVLISIAIMTNYGSTHKKNHWPFCLEPKASQILWCNCVLEKRCNQYINCLYTKKSKIIITEQKLPK